MLDFGDFPLIARDLAIDGVAWGTVRMIPPEAAAS
jgi:hypothetical protein